MTDSLPFRRARPGGRSAKVRAAVLAAALDHLLAVGYARFAVGPVAAAAGVHPTSIYRRWGGKAGLVLAACLAFSAESVAVPDTGTLESDLTGLFAGLIAHLATPAGRAMLELSRAAEPEIAAARAAFWRARFDIAGDIFVRAARRGEIDLIMPPDLLVEWAIAPIYMRLLAVGGDPSSLPVATIARAVARGLTADGRKIAGSP